MPLPTQDLRRDEGRSSRFARGVSVAAAGVVPCLAASLAILLELAPLGLPRLASLGPPGQSCRFLPFALAPPLPLLLRPSPLLRAASLSLVFLLLLYPHLLFLARPLCLVLGRRLLRTAQRRDDLLVVGDQRLEAEAEVEDEHLAVLAGAGLGLGDVAPRLIELPHEDLDVAVGHGLDLEAASDDLPHLTQSEVLPAAHME